MVDWYWARGNADFSDFVFAEPEVAHFDQPVRGSNDAVRGSLRRHFSADPYGASVDGLLHVPLSEHDGTVATVSQPADLGRVCGFNLRHRIGIVLVRRIDSRFGDTARPRDE